MNSVYVLKDKKNTPIGVFETMDFLTKYCRDNNICTHYVEALPWNTGKRLYRVFQCQVMAPADDGLSFECVKVLSQDEEYRAFSQKEEIEIIHEEYQTFSVVDGKSDYKALYEVVVSRERLDVYEGFLKGNEEFVKEAVQWHMRFKEPLVGGMLFEIRFSKDSDEILVKPQKMDWCYSPFLEHEKITKEVLAERHMFHTRMEGSSVHECCQRMSWLLEDIQKNERKLETFSTS